MELVRCSALAVGREGRAVCSGIDLAISTGDLLCIVGENGAGKSTLLATMLGLLKPVAGTVEFAEGLGPGDIGYLPQQTDVQRDFPATVGEVVLSGCLPSLGARPFYSRADRERAAENMGRCGVADLEKRSCRELSGGQRQRVLLARALCAAGRILFLDEPVAGLDPDAARGMYATIDELAAGGLTIVMVTHDVDEALSHATHVLHLGGAPSFERVGTRGQDATCEPNATCESGGTREPDVTRESGETRGPGGEVGADV